MFRKHQLIRITLLALLMVCPLWVFAQKDGHTLSITVTEKGTREAIIMATLQLSPWQYDASKRHISRADCVALNGMAEDICNQLNDN